MTTETTDPIGPKTVFGRPVSTAGVPDLYADTPVIRWSPPRPGIDNLGLHSWDTFAIPGLGEFDVEFEGYVRVVRSEPTHDEWASAEVYTNLIEMKMTGQSEALGTITVTLNPECLSAGQSEHPSTPTPVRGRQPRPAGWPWAACSRFRPWG